MKRALLIVLLLATAAHATPPRVTESDDRLIAATQTHFYVLRDVVDNRGSHYSELRDQYLVEISLDDGRATQAWLLRSMQIDHLAGNIYLAPGSVTERSGETFDLTALLAEAGAAPMRLQHYVDPELMLDDAVLRHADGRLLATLADIGAAAKAQLLPLAVRYPPLASDQNYGSVDVFEYYVMGDPAAWLCELQPGMRHLYREAGELRLVPVNCEDENTLGRWTFHMILPGEIWN